MVYIILLLPIEQILPYMISNVHSFTTSTRRPVSIIRWQLDRWKLRLFGGRRRQQRHESRRILAQKLDSWLDIIAARRLNSLSNATVCSTPIYRPRKSDKITIGANDLQCLGCRMDLPLVEHKYRLDPEQIIKFETKFIHALKDETLHLISMFQHRCRWHWHQRDSDRSFEFEIWVSRTQCGSRTLAVISTSVLVIIALFSLCVCLMIAGTFTDKECTLWGLDVLQAILIQLFVTGPLLNTTVLCVKIICSAVLLKTGRRNQIQQKVVKIQRQTNCVVDAERSFKARMVAEEARNDALRVLATGDAHAVATARIQHQSTKRYHENHLVTIDERRKASRQPHTNESHKSDTVAKTATAMSAAKLSDREKKSLTMIGAADAALAALRLADGVDMNDARQFADFKIKVVNVQVQATKARLANLHQRLVSLKDTKRRLNVFKTKKLTELRKLNKAPVKHEDNEHVVPLRVRCFETENIESESAFRLQVELSPSNVLREQPSPDRVTLGDIPVSTIKRTKPNDTINNQYPIAGGARHKQSVIIKTRRNLNQLPTVSSSINTVEQQLKATHHNQRTVTSSDYSAPSARNIQTDPYENNDAKMTLQTTMQHLKAKVRVSRRRVRARKAFSVPASHLASTKKTSTIRATANTAQSHNSRSATKLTQIGKRRVTPQMLQKILDRRKQRMRRLLKGRQVSI